MQEQQGHIQKLIIKSLPQKFGTASQQPKFSPNISASQRKFPNFLVGKITLKETNQQRPEEFKS